MATYSPNSSYYSQPMSISGTSDDRNRSASPTFLIYRDFDTDNFEEVFQRAMAKDDVVTVLTKSLRSFERIVEHLRMRGEPEVANDFAKRLVGIVSEFNDVTADWDIEKCLMDDIPPDRSSPLKNQIEQTLGVGSWASIAATPTGNGNSLVVHRPGDGLQRTVADQNDQGMYVAQSDARVVWIKPKDQDLQVEYKDITKAICQGPLYSMAYSPDDHAVCVVFQRYEDAQAFLGDAMIKMRKNGFGPLGPHYDVLPGQGYPMNAELKRMEYPRNERRRLTFVRSQLFCGAMNEEVFKRDIYKMIGREHVELVWLFNTGNATVVFTAVSIARKCREDFIRLSNKNGPYKGIQVSYSHDPCERMLHLVSQMQDPNARRPGNTRGSSSRSTSYGISNFGGPSVPPSRPVSRPPAQCPRREVGSGRVQDDEGWQTVVGRRR